MYIPHVFCHLCTPNEYLDKFGVVDIQYINDIGMYGAFSPNGRIFAFSSTTGIYQMNPDGTELSKLLEIPAADSLSWVP